MTLAKKAELAFPLDKAGAVPVEIQQRASVERVLLEVAELILMALDEGIIAGQRYVEALAELQRRYALGLISLEEFHHEAKKVI